MTGKQPKFESDRSSFIAGGFIAISLACLIVSIFVSTVSGETFVDPIARVLDSFAPLFAGMSLVLACLSLFMGARSAGWVLVASSLVAGAVQYSSYHAVSVPEFKTGPIAARILFFNARAGNPNADEIVARAMETQADILVFAEAEAIRPALDGIEKTYDFVSPCKTACELLVASNLEVLRFWRLGLNPVWPERYAVLEFQSHTGDPAYLSIVHLAKPWLSGIAGSELARLTAQYNWFDGPVVAVGDFNAAPWSLPVRRLLQRTGFKAFRGQPGSWPAGAPLSVPIDLVLVRDGLRVSGIQRFGEHLGSNHIGFVADVVFEDAAVD